MGAFEGNLSFKLFFVEGDIPDDWKDRYLQQINHLAFEPLNPDSDEDESIGWVEIERPLRTDFNLHTVLYNDFINLGFRRDKYALPADLMKATLAEAEREFKEQNKKTRLTKFERDDLKAAVRRKLKQQNLPRMKVIDASWEMTQKRVRFWSQSAATVELFQEYFEDTFDVRLIPSNPYIQGLQLDLDDTRLGRLAATEPSNFTTGKLGLEF